MLDTTIWIAQSFLALFFFAAGVPKVIGRGIDRWVGFDDLPRPLVVLIGACEVAAALALVAPMVAGHGQWTTPLAAIGIAVVSLMASGFHIRQAEWLPGVETALWASLAAAIAIARWDEMSTGPSISADALAPVVAVLVPAIIVNLVLLFRQPIQPKPENQKPLVSTR
jgi:DoxX-like family